MEITYDNLKSNIQKRVNNIKSVMDLINDIKIKEKIENFLFLYEESDNLPLNVITEYNESFFIFEGNKWMINKNITAKILEYLLKHRKNKKRKIIIPYSLATYFKDKEVCNQIIYKTPSARNTEIMIIEKYYDNNNNLFNIEKYISEMEKYITTGEEVMKEEWVIVTFPELFTTYFTEFQNKFEKTINDRYNGFSSINLDGILPIFLYFPETRKNIIEFTQQYKNLFNGDIRIIAVILPFIQDIKPEEIKNIEMLFSVIFTLTLFMDNLNFHSVNYIEKASEVITKFLAEMKNLADREILQREIAKNITHAVLKEISNIYFPIPYNPSVIDYLFNEKVNVESKEIFYLPYKSYFPDVEISLHYSIYVPLPLLLFYKVPFRTITFYSKSKIITAIAYKEHIQDKKLLKYVDHILQEKIIEEYIIESKEENLYIPNIFFKFVETILQDDKLSIERKTNIIKSVIYYSLVLEHQETLNIFDRDFFHIAMFIARNNNELRDFIKTIYQTIDDEYLELPPELILLVVKDNETIEF